MVSAPSDWGDGFGNGAGVNPHSDLRLWANLEIDFERAVPAEALTGFRPTLVASDVRI